MSTKESFTPSTIKRIGMSKSSSWWYIVLLCIVSCQDESAMEFAVSPEFSGIVDRFKVEAEHRNVIVDLQGLGINFGILDQSAIGRCLTYQSGRREIVIEKSYWRRTTDIEKELLLFHELGHCILGRSHDDSTTSLGACKSLMTSGKNNCTLDYSYDTRTAYLDELFNF